MLHEVLPVKLMVVCACRCVDAHLLNHGALSTMIYLFVVEPLESTVSVCRSRVTSTSVGKIIGSSGTCDV